MEIYEPQTVERVRFPQDAKYGDMVIVINRLTAEAEVVEIKARRVETFQRWAAMKGATFLLSEKEAAWDYVDWLVLQKRLELDSLVDAQKMSMAVIDSAPPCDPPVKNSTPD